MKIGGGKKDTNTYLQAISPMSTPICPLPVGDFDLHSTINLFHKALSTRGSRATIDNLDTVAFHEFQANALKLRAVI